MSMFVYLILTTILSFFIASVLAVTSYKVKDPFIGAVSGMVSSVLFMIAIGWLLVLIQCPKG